MKQVESVPPHLKTNHDGWGLFGWFTRQWMNIVYTIWQWNIWIC